MELMIKLVNQNNFCYAPDELKVDEEIVLESNKNDVCSFDAASVKLQFSREVAIETFKTKGLILIDLCEKLKVRNVSFSKGINSMSSIVSKNNQIKRSLWFHFIDAWKLQVISVDLSLSDKNVKLKVVEQPSKRFKYSMWRSKGG